MNATVNKLTAIIDQLLVLHRENPHLNVPEKEKKRLEMVVHKLLGKETFTAQEWEKVKPFNPEPQAKIEERRKILRKEKTKEAIEAVRNIKENQILIKDTERLKKLNMEMENKLRIAISGKVQAKPDLMICKTCKKRFTMGEYEEHIKICGRKKGKKRMKQ
ncbi:MAG: hypothetical protein U0U70_00645 [Chitinophagaceae bacterium]